MARKYDQTTLSLAAAPACAKDETNIRYWSRGSLGPLGMRERMKLLVIMVNYRVAATS